VRRARRVHEGRRSYPCAISSSSIGFGAQASSILERGGAFFTRTGYVGVYDVADVQADVANGLRFQFTGRYHQRIR
jgi:hypothetical protein